MTDMTLKGNFSASRETAEIVRQSLKKRYAVGDGVLKSTV